VFLKKRRRRHEQRSAVRRARTWWDVDQRTWNKGVIVATLLAAFVVVGVVWLATTLHTLQTMFHHQRPDKQQSPARGKIGSGRDERRVRAMTYERASPPITA